MFKINLHKIKFITPSMIPWIIWSIAGLFYFYDIILRIYPSTIETQFTRAFQINATQFGFFTACYYITYTAMQIPAGIIVDRISIYKTLFLACLSCLFGIGLIHYYDNIMIAQIGRMIIGFGASFAYVATLKVASIWLPADRFGIATTIADSLGMLGGIFTDEILGHINQSAGFRESETWLIVSGVIIALLILFVLKDRPEKTAHPAHNINLYDPRKILNRLKNIATSKQIWLIGIVGCLYYLPSSVVGDVWGIPFLKSVYHLSETNADHAISFFFAGWIIVGPIFGLLSDKFRNRWKPITYCVVGNLILFTAIVYLPPLGITPGTGLTFVLFFFVGAFTGAHPLVFALAKENFSLRSTGTVIAFTNTLVMIGGVIFQPATGFLLDMVHHTIGKVGAETYSVHDYTIAMTIMPVSMLITLGLMYFVKDTGSRIDQHNEQRPH
ncbi:MAG: MFS transporter [Coxiellaceae bacterium]|nr:MFS transporter [Coxiellaceae bacterium]